MCGRTVDGPGRYLDVVLDLTLAALPAKAVGEALGADSVKVKPGEPGEQQLQLERDPASLRTAQTPGAVAAAVAA